VGKFLLEFYCAFYGRELKGCPKNVEISLKALNQHSSLTKKKPLKSNLPNNIPSAIKISSHKKIDSTTFFH
jgi:hypothetical protein